MKCILTIAASSFLLASLTSASWRPHPEGPPKLYNRCRCRAPAPPGSSQGPDWPNKTEIACQHYAAGTYRGGSQAYVRYDPGLAECRENGASLGQEVWNDVCIRDGAGSGQCWNDKEAPGWYHCRCRGPAPKGQPPFQGPDMPAVSQQVCGEYNGRNVNGWTASVYYHDSSDECRTDDGSLDPGPWEQNCKKDGAASGQCWR